MKYIPGFEFVAGTKNTLKQGGSILENMAIARKKQGHNSSLHDSFQFGAVYKILYIKPLKDNITYQFLEILNNNNKAIINVDFLNITEAEDIISKLSGTSTN